MSVEVNKDIVRRLTDSFNRQDLSVIEQLVAVNYVDHDPFDGQPPGREGMKMAHRTFYTGFPDIHETIEDLFAEEDRVVARWVCRGTHLGEFVGIPPTGKTVAVTGIDIYRIVDGQVAENWHNVDGLGLLYQIGAVPPIWLGVVYGGAARLFGRLAGLLPGRRARQRANS